MKDVLHKTESIVDRSIPYIVILLLFIIISDFFLKEIYYKYELYFAIGDYFVLSVFIIDLIFKFNRVRQFKVFLRKYWLDIIAVFPFFLLFRVFEEVVSLLRIRSELSRGQNIIHSGLEIERLAKEETLLRELEEGGKLFQEGEKLTRTEELTKIVRPITRTPRMLEAVTFYEKPIKKDYKKTKKLFEKEIRRIEEDIKKA